ncbi:MAG TPA: sigma-54 dependent transcriptional regulator [Pyrinomonadaceae bacterium]|jgi:transcriptional regulator with PAS, ATPase and Fis domain|nr:sigma-54 dependent transcriptional regulator [Pyrinomonadaceae bacterium]
MRKTQATTGAPQQWFPSCSTELLATVASLHSILKDGPFSEKQILEVRFHLEKISGQISAPFADQGGHSNLSAVQIISPPVIASQENQLTFCSSAMHQLMTLAKRTANSDMPVLISGETGVGKELMARYIHLNSPSHGGPLIPFNCAAVPRELFESHLFGHKQGAFTGATKDQVGIIRAAAGGTLLLDEVGELPLDLQPKLLRFLEEGEVHRVGDDRPAHVKVRIIALTNRDLEAEVAAHRFRADLYYRLNVLQLTVPSLRERPEDVPILIDFFLDKYSIKTGNSKPRFTPDALERFAASYWPGNVRELNNRLLKLLTVAEHNGLITVDDLPSEIRLPSPADALEIDQRPNGHSRGPIDLSADLMLGEAINRVERHYVRGALLRHDGNYSNAARQLGLSTFGLRKKYRRLFPNGNSTTSQESGNRTDN